jgi:hypothetical protein
VFTNVAVSNDEVLSDTPYDAAPVPTVQHASLQLFIHAVVAGILASVVDDGIAAAALARSQLQPCAVRTPGRRPPVPEANSAN